VKATKEASATEIAVGSVIGWRLGRHHLLERTKVDPVRIARDLFGIHAQIASAAELAVAVRSDGLRPGRVGALIAEKRDLAKAWAMRGTLHYFAPEDLALWVAAVRERKPYLQPAWQRGFKVSLQQMEALLAAIPRALDGRALTREELDDEVARLTDGSLRGRLKSGWGELLKPAVQQGLVCFGPARGQNVTFVRPDQWIAGWKPMKLTPEDALRQIARRYLHTYGPASHEHFAAWLGTRPAEGRRAFKGLAEAGELVDLDLAGDRVVALAADLPAMRSASVPVDHLRLLGRFDPYKIGVRPRGIFVPDAYYDRVYLKQGWMSPVVLRAGRAVATWDAARGGRRTTVSISPFVSLPKRALDDAEREARRLAPFLGGGEVDVLSA
jgi:hypothetical protein